jgi:hypothetical protein
MDYLRAYDPLLADRLLLVAHAAECVSRQKLNSTLSEETTAQAISQVEEAGIHFRHASEWDELLGEIRALPGFQALLRPGPLGLHG